MDSWNDIPMSGRSDPFTVSLGQSSTGPSISFVLRRIAARLNITLTEGSGVTFKTMKIVNLPNKTYYVSRPLTTERSLADATDDSGRIGGKDAVNVSTPTDWIAESATLSGKSVSLYMFENRPGVTTNTNQAAKGKANAPDTRCTHLVITGEDSNNTYEWTFYLGGDPTSNYNIKRNSVYTITATLKNSSVSDVRVVAVSKIQWAGSNIYWDGSKLTFDAVGTTSKQYYQGVFFQWGSLVGISPAQTPVGTDEWSGSVIVYVSSKYTGSSSKPTYSSKTASAAGYGTYRNIPYENNQSLPDYYSRETNHLYYSDQATKTSMWGSGKGDICQYLGEIGAAPSGYRMPRSVEFGAADDYTSGGTYSTDTSLGNAQGTKDLSSYGWIKKGYSPTIPAAGYRNGTGLLKAVGGGGYYWSSSAYFSIYGYYLFLNSEKVNPSGQADRYIAYPVRCIKD
jgi:uncharacterized protein (TIGR02145 family)